MLLQYHAKQKLLFSLFFSKYKEACSEEQVFFHNPKKKMALIFRWYLGLASRWSNIGEKGREMDYQIWCGPSMGAFNSWVKNSYLEKPENRTVVDVAKHILTGAAYLYRIQNLAGQGIYLSPDYLVYTPEKKMIL